MNDTADGVIDVSDPGPTAGVYTISVAAELAGVNVRSLRLYERTPRLRRDDLLTPREHEVLGLVSRGLTNREIANRWS